MTNLQLVLSVGIPSLLILISWLSNNARLSDLAKRVDNLETNLGGRIDRLEHRIERLEVRFDRVEDEIRKDHENRLTRLEGRVFAA